MGQKLDSIDETRIFLRPPAQTAQDPSLLGAEGQPRAGILARHLDHLLFLHVIVALLAPHGRVGARQVRQQRAVDPTLIEAPQKAQTVLLQARQWLQDDRRLASCCPYLGSPTSGSSMMRGSFSLAALDVGEPGGDAGGEKGSYSTAGTASGSEKSAKLGRRRPGGSKDLRWPSKSWLRLAPNSALATCGSNLGRSNQALFDPGPRPCLRPYTVLQLTFKAKHGVASSHDWLPCCRA